MSSTTTEFTELAREYCHIRGLSITQLAGRMGLSREEVSRLVNGRSKPFSYKVAAMATALGLSDDEEQELWRAAGVLPTPASMRRLCVCDRVLPVRPAERAQRDRAQVKATLTLNRLIEWYGGLEKLRQDVTQDLKMGGGYQARAARLLVQLQRHRKRG